jgi:hypothetical protein
VGSTTFFLPDKGPGPSCVLFNHITSSTPDHPSTFFRLLSLLGMIIHACLRTKALGTLLEERVHGLDGRRGLLRYGRGRGHLLAAGRLFGRLQRKKATRVGQRVDTW